jgi:hypothetical protein
MADSRLAEIAKNGEANTATETKVGAKVGHQHDGRTSTLDKMQDPIRS